MFTFLLAAVTVTASFEGGSIGGVEQVAPDHLRCAVKGQADQNNRNRQANWYYFRVDNLPRGEFWIEFTGTSWVADGAVRFLLSDDAEAVRLRRSTLFKVLPMFDPDGVAEGAVRFNVNGFDNNRSWDAVDPKLMPEIAAARRAMLGWVDAGNRIDVFLALHNTESTDYVEGPVAAGGPAVAAVAYDLVKRLRETTNFYDPASPRGSKGGAPIDKGRMTVNQNLFAERKIAAFLMELMVERHPKLGRPRTARDYSSFGAGLAQCLAGAVEGR